MPEFPGQTHVFFWRERAALAEMGVDAEFVSTRRPPRAISSHAWSSDAARRTEYLMPFGWRDIGPAALEILQAGPAAWMRLLGVAALVKNASLRERLRMLAMAAPAARLARHARSHGWRHIHVHSCANAANVAMLCRLLSGVPYSLTLHGPLEDYGPNQELKWKHADFAIVITRLLMRAVEDRLGAILPKRVELAPMGVDLERISRSRPYGPWQAGEICRIFSCGRLNPVKGHDRLFRTVRALREDGIDVRLRIAGEDEKGGSGYRRELEAMIAATGLAPCVELLGAVSEEQIREELEKAHVFALASHIEGVSVAIMEAMAMGMPVVVTDVGGNHELIDDGIDAVLVAPSRPDELTNAIRRILADSEFALALARASRAKVASQFHHRRSAAAIAACLRDIQRR